LTQKENESEAIFTQISWLSWNENEGRNLNFVQPFQIDPAHF
jgi:hypothetical protein